MNDERYTAVLAPRTIIRRWRGNRPRNPASALSPRTRGDEPVVQPPERRHIPWKLAFQISCKLTVKGVITSNRPACRFALQVFGRAHQSLHARCTGFDLASGRDIGRIWRLAERLEYGMVGINTGLISTEVVPFGGMKQSGIWKDLMMGLFCRKG
jgi:hypothetical protein